MQTVAQAKTYLLRVWHGIRLLPNLRRSQIPLVLDSLNKKDLISLTACAALFALAGGFLVFAASSKTATGAPDYGGEIVEGLVGQPQFVNPVLAPASSVDSDISKVVYAQLLKFDKNLQLAADLAAGMPEISDDQKTYTLRLKPGLKWHDGRPIVADDVVFTVETIQNADYESPLRTNWTRVHVQKTDDLTVVFTLREISASFITNFTLQIIPKHVWEGLNPNSFRLSDLNLRPIGSGPFAFREIKKTADGTIRSMTLRAFEDYHAGRPYLDWVTFKFYNDYDALINAFQGKQINAVGYLPFDRRSLENNGRFDQHKFNIPQYQAVFFNIPKSSILGDRAVRQALQLATDRQTIIDEVYMGYAKQVHGPILEGNLGYNPAVTQTVRFDLDEAARTLNNAGWTVDPNTNVRNKSGTRLEFNLATNNNIINVKTAQALQAQWQKLGVIVNLVIVSAQELETDYIRPRNFEALLFFENTGADPDPYPFWHSSQARDPNLNLSGFSNADADRLLTEARQTTNVEQRAANYRQFQAIVAAEVPAVFLNNVVYVYNVPQELGGLDLDTIIQPAERFLNIGKWYAETR